MDIELLVKFVLLPLLTVICTMGWWMHKKHELRLDRLEMRTSEIEKAIIEIKTEFRFISRDIKEIKEMLVKISDHK